MSFAFEAFCFCWENLRKVFICLHLLIFLFWHCLNKHHIVRDSPALWLWIADHGLGDQPCGWWQRRRWWSPSSRHLGGGWKTRGKTNDAKSNENSKKIWNNLHWFWMALQVEQGQIVSAQTVQSHWYGCSSMIDDPSLAQDSLFKRPFKKSGPVSKKQWCGVELGQNLETLERKNTVRHRQL